MFRRQNRKTKKRIRETDTDGDKKKSGASDFEIPIRQSPLVFMSHCDATAVVRRSVNAITPTKLELRHQRRRVVWQAVTT